MGRDYDNSNRARQAQQTSVSILESAERLLRRIALADVTLADIADGAGVSVQTVLRHHGSRDGVLEAMARMVGERIQEQRQRVEPGDVEGAVDNVLQHYEEEGDLVLRVLSEEASSSFAADAAQQGRAFHRAWVKRAFGPLLVESDDERARLQIDSLVVATDLYTWRLLRRDLGRDLDDVRRTMLHLVHTILGGHR